MDQRFNIPYSNNTHPQWALWNGVEGLFIASNRVGGFGDLDIWFVPMTSHYYEKLNSNIHRGVHFLDAINKIGFGLVVYNIAITWIESAIVVAQLPFNKG